MLDRLERSDDVGRRGRQWYGVAVQIGAMEGRVRRQPGMPRDVDTDVVGSEVARILEEPADAAPDVDEDTAGAPGAQQGRCGAINRRIALALAVQPTLDRGIGSHVVTRSSARETCGSTTAGAQRAAA